MKKTIILESITFHNWKSFFGSHTFKFNQSLTQVFGKNGLGKSSLYDGFLWCLFGKDAFDRADFEIKPVDENNETLFPNTEHSVTTVLKVDGRTETYTRIYREKWNKSGSEWSGHTTNYFVNLVPIDKASDYKAKVSSIIDEQVFKLITSITYFNTLGTEVKREILTKVADEIDERALMDTLPNLEHLIEELTIGNRLDDYKKRLNAQLDSFKKELDRLPIAIEEAKRAIVITDYAAVEKEQTENNTQIAEIELKLSDIVKRNEAANEVKLKKQKELFAKKEQLQAIELSAKQTAEASARAKVNELGVITKEIDSIAAQSLSLSNQKRSVQASIDSVTAQRAIKIKEWKDINSMAMPELESTCCPACNRELEAADIESKKADILKKYTDDKKNKLDIVLHEGNQLKDKLAGYEKQMTELNEQAQKLDDRNEELKAQLEAIKGEINAAKEVESETIMNEYNRLGYTEIQKEIVILEAETKEEITEDDETRQLLTEQLGLLRSESNRLITLLAGRETEKRQNARILELETQQRTIANEMTVVEGKLKSISAFEDKKIAEVESRVNAKFKLVKFKMFNKLLNGNIENVCIPLVDGVPYAALNTAKQVNAGLDIVNTLSEFYEISAPVFVDRVESVNDLLPIDSQVIELVVTKTDDKLRIV